MRKEEIKELIFEAFEDACYFMCHECYWDIDDCPLAKLGKLFGVECKKKVFDYGKLIGKLKESIDIVITREVRPNEDTTG